MNASSLLHPKLRLSLTARLTLLFALGATVVLLGLGWLISQSIERHFEELDREALQHKLMLAHHAIARVTSTTELARLPSLLSDAATGHHAQRDAGASGGGLSAVVRLFFGHCP